MALQHEQGLHEGVLLDGEGEHMRKRRVVAEVSVWPFLPDYEQNLRLRAAEVKEEIYEQGRPFLSHRYREFALRLTHLPTGIQMEHSGDDRRYVREVAATMLRSMVHGDRKLGRPPTLIRRYIEGASARVENLITGQNFKSFERILQGELHLIW